MPLDAELEPIVQLINSAAAPDPGEQDVADLRDAYGALSTLFGAGDPDVVTDDATAGGLPVRRYRPSGATGRLPTLVYLHGGGFVIGSIETHDALCRDLCAASGWQVLSVDYRRAPEHRYPSAHDDALAAVRGALEQADELEIDTTCWAVGGDSAGAHLATVTCRRLRDEGSDLPALQVLIYPVTDLADPDAHRSYHDNAEGYVLTAATMRFFADAYVPEVDRRSEPDASPLRAELSGLPPALVLTAEYDPLRDEGEAYAAALRDAGVRCTLTRYDGAVHMFAQMGSTAIAARLRREIVQALSEAGS